MTMRVAGLLWCFVAACSATGCSSRSDAPDAAAPTRRAAATTEQVQPRIVAQLTHQVPVRAVRWLNRGRHLLSLGEDASLVVWDVGTGDVVDTARLPINPRLLVPGEWPERSDPTLHLHSVAPGSAPDTFVIAYEAADAATAQRACPDGHRMDSRFCLFAFDARSRRVSAEAGLTVPTSAQQDTATAWPDSPDGRLHPVPNYADGVRGSLDRQDEHPNFPEPTCVSFNRCRNGVTLLSTATGAVHRALVAHPRSFFTDADLSSDGLRLVRVEGLYRSTRSRVETLDLGSGTGAPAFVPERPYHGVSWVDVGQYLLASQGYEVTADSEEALGAFPPTLRMQAGCAAQHSCPQLESRWQTQALPDGTLIALGRLDAEGFRCYLGGREGAACVPPEQPGSRQESYDPTPSGLMQLQVGADRWRPLGPPASDKAPITAFAVSPDGRQIAVATREWQDDGSPTARQILRVALMTRDGEALSAPQARVEISDPLGTAARFTDAATIRRLSFSADGRRIVFAHVTPEAALDASRVADLYVVDTAGPAPARTVPSPSRHVVALGEDRVLGLDDGALLDLDTLRPVARLPAGSGFMRAGWIERSALLWATTDDGAIHLFDTRTGSPQLTLQTFPDNRFFAARPDGRYDTNLGPDTPLVRWMVPDAPWQSLAAQTFMRDYYEPGLYRRLLDCREKGDCGQVFKPLPSIASLNRVLPEVRITEIGPGEDAASARVTLEVRERVQADAPNGKQRSGAFNPRLFRNGRLVAMSPQVSDAADEDLPTWRRRNAVPARDGVMRIQYTVPLPTQAGEEQQVFSAYAFNEDRIKGDTVTRTYVRPPVTARTRRAYVLAIGIDDYDTPRFQLKYAVADARRMASSLMALPGYETHVVTLAGERAAGGGRVRVDRESLAEALSLLSTTGDRGRALAALDRKGIDAHALAPATPDDVVIVSYSGHGWANARGDFFLIPADGQWPTGEASPAVSTLFSTAQLVAPLQNVQAGEVALVIDACHSAASVADGRFKPGPMGDSGLGQLAFDKGFRILAATQADDVALEDARLGQGLLTYALAVDGLERGAADLDSDGRTRIDEWLSYAVARLPTLAEDTRVGRVVSTGVGARAITFHDLPAGAPARRVQHPALFDFNARASAVVLRESGR